MSGITRLDRFFAKVIKDGPIPSYRPSLGACWIWTGAKYTHTSHGKFWFTGRVRPAHAASYELFVGPIPEGLEIDHLCRVPSCVNPKHLEAVTHQENMARGFYGMATHCPEGHPYEGDNLYLDPRGERQCRACRRAAMARFNQKRGRA